MAKAMCSGRKSMIDKKIEQFCEGTAELLSGIHDKYDSMNPVGQKKKRKRRQRKK